MQKFLDYGILYIITISEVFMDYKVLIRLVTENEAQAIREKDADHVGSRGVATVCNTSSSYTKDENVAYCYSTEISANSLEEAKSMIEENLSIIIEDNDVSEGLSYMYREKQKFNPDNYSVICIILPEKEFDKWKLMGSVEECVGFYENEYEEQMEIPETVVTSDSLCAMSNRDNSIEFYTEDLIKRGIIKTDDMDNSHTNDDGYNDGFGYSDDFDR